MWGEGAELQERFYFCGYALWKDTLWMMAGFIFFFGTPAYFQSGKRDVARCNFTEEQPFS